MAALQYVDVPGYAALLLRRTYSQLTKSDSLVPRSHEWLRNTDAEWNDKKMMWTFPSGAIIEFGHMQYENDKFNYQSAAYQFIGFDELTQFSQSQYLYLHSRTRRPNDPENPLSYVPIRVRAATNPGGIGHAWVRERFVLNGKKNGRPFIPARLDDNPHLDKETYERSLMNLDPITRKQLKDGDWTARHAGSIFKREWFDRVFVIPSGGRAVRFWDLAHSRPKSGQDPDYTVGLKYIDFGHYCLIADIQRFRESPSEVENKIKIQARRDGPETAIRMEQEPAGGKAIIEHYALKVLKGYNFMGAAAGNADPAVRWGPVASFSEQGHVKILDADWNDPFFEELEIAPFGSHDDQITAWAGAHKYLIGGSLPADIY
jgi:phage terminase large subunit-like protein